MPEEESKNAMKKRLKAEEAAKKAAEKAAAKAAKEAAAPKKEKKFVAGEEDVDPTAYYANRQNAVNKMLEEGGGRNPYPHKFEVSHRLPDFLEEFGPEATDGNRLDKTVTVAGRITSVRGQGKLYFYDIKGEGAELQIMSDLQTYENEDGFNLIHRTLKRGDIVGVEGAPGKSKNGQLSIFPKSMKLLSPCLHMLPQAKGQSREALFDQETRYRNRYLDLICNHDNWKTFATRSKVISYVRRYLDSRHFMEVETPSLCLLPGGATAKPFKTFHNDLSQEMFMRIAPELNLKKLVIGGIDRVYELGRNYRNEGIDLTHNPEFTTCEFYMAYADYNDLMKMTEEMVSGMVMQICGSYVIKFSPKPGAPEVEVDFTPPFKRISMISGLEEVMGMTLPKMDDPKAAEKLKKIIDDRKLECQPPHSTMRLLDTLVGEYLEDGIVNPTFICDHPQIMSPLAKYHRDDPLLTERFELFVAGRELANAYTELNNPMVQRKLFMDQASQNQDGDDEAMVMDDSFVVALEHGLPPTAGWGLGIDRLAMFLSNKNNIKEVLFFPAMKPNAEELALLEANKPKEDDDEAGNRKRFPKCSNIITYEGDDISTENGMKKLNSKLEGKLFLGDSAGAADVKLFAELEKLPKEAVEYFANVKAYFGTVAQFGAAVRANWK
jgi:lysyl-tRNA synthetase class 2